MTIIIMPLASALGKPELIGISKKHRIQMFDLDSVKNKLQVELAFLHAEEAFKEKRNISKDRQLEVLIRAAATRQISEAVRKIGIRDPKRMLAACKTDECKMTEFEIRTMLKAKKIHWKQEDSSEEIRRMIETEVGE